MFSVVVKFEPSRKPHQESGGVVARPHAVNLQNNSLITRAKVADKAIER